MLVKSPCKIQPCVSTKSFNHVQLFETLWSIACQAPLSMRFSRQGYWSGWPCPLPGDLLNPGIELTSPMSSEGRFFSTSTSWEAHNLVFLTLYIVGCGWGRFPSPSSFATWMNGLPGGSDSRESSCNVTDQGLTLGKKWQSAPVFFPRESHGQRSLEGPSPWGHKSQMWLSD